MILFTRLFESFLRKRHTAGHFRRQAMPLANSTARTVPVPDHLARQLVAAATEALPAALARLASREAGLSGDEAQAVLAQTGPNEVEHEKPLAWYQHLWLCYKNPFNLLLTVLAIVSYLTEDAKATIVIGSMVILSTLLRFVQEGRSNRAAERLKAMVGNTATVLRDGRQLELAIRQLVQGDIIVLSAGDMIPADCRLLTAKDLFVSQSAMTGESLPVEKMAELADGMARIRWTCPTCCSWAPM